MVSIWLFVLLLAILYDHMIMYVGLFGHSAVVFHVFMFFSCVFCVLLTLCVVVFFQWHFIVIFSCIAASLFNKLTYLPTRQCWLQLWVSCTVVRRCCECDCTASFGADYKCPNSTQHTYRPKVGQMLPIFLFYAWDKPIKILPDVWFGIGKLWSFYRR